MIELKEKSTNAHLVIIRSSKGSVEYDNEEFISLTLSTGAAVKGITYVDARKFIRSSLIGKGKMKEIKDEVDLNCSDLIVFNYSLSASQERNLEQYFKIRVIDRTRLILDIFAQRARTNTGKLQVELAQLTHLSTRLIRGWTHLERQKGGIGLRGPGETQLETDRRLIQNRIKSIKSKLKKISTQRQTTRKSRNKVMKNVALVGYTNAGKTTLFNTLCGENALAEDKLFATLDPLFRPVSLPKNRKAILSDTVGFIKELPSELIEAFLSTLEEVTNADVLIHVIDVSDRFMYENKRSVNEVLTTIGADKIPVINVYNKIDLMKEKINLINDDNHIQISAKDGLGIENLLHSVSKKIKPEPISALIQININQSKERALIYSQSSVIQEKLIDNNLLEMNVEIDMKSLKKMKKYININVVESKLQILEKKFKKKSGIKE
ncbi:GTPase HflX [Gammaproteobacteria bacterium]|nr:GTPase HflX [Gammaproteobacteria bacterium]